jgi:hypothetical protein
MSTSFHRYRVEMCVTTRYSLELVGKSKSDALVTAMSCYDRHATECFEPEGSTTSRWEVKRTSA